MTENVRKVFDMLGVEPNEEFKMLVGKPTKFIYKCKISESLQGYYFDGEDWIFFDELLKDLLNGSNTIIKIPKKKHVGDKECLDFKDCKDCPFKAIDCLEEKINIYTLYDILDSWFQLYKDQEIYEILKSRLDKEVEE